MHLMPCGRSGYLVSVTRFAVVALLVSVAACAAGGSTEVAEEAVEPASTVEQPATTIPAVSVEVPTSTPTPTSFSVYVSLTEPGRVVALDLDDGGGLSLREEGAVDLTGPAGSSVHGEVTDRLFVRSGNGIATIELHPNGPESNPTLLGVTAVDGEPVYLDLSPTEDALVAAYFGEDQVRVHSIADDAGARAVDAYPVDQALDSGTEPHAASIGPSGTRVYAPHRNGDMISVYQIEPQTDRLVLIGEVPAEAGAGPRHIAFDPDGRFAYVINEHADSVTSYRIETDGLLEPIHTVSTLPEGFDPEANTGADIHVTPDGGFLYASNRGHDSIAGFAIGADGQLEAIGHTPTQARPRDFGMSPDGRFLVVAGQDSGSVESYRLGADGGLTSAGSVAVGEGPVWVAVLP